MTFGYGLKAFYSFTDSSTEMVFAIPIAVPRDFGGRDNSSDVQGSVKNP